MGQQFEAQRGFCQCTTKIHRRSRSVVGSAEAERFVTDCNVCEFSFGKNLSVRLVCAVLGFFAGSCRVCLTAAAWVTCEVLSGLRGSLGRQKDILLKMTLPLTLFGELQKDIWLKMTLPLTLFGELRTVLTITFCRQPVTASLCPQPFQIKRCAHMMFLCCLQAFRSRQHLCISDK